uniref:Uncharacterized protein n=1 Tax=Heterorhabditis bacteriophora TaxID=37862 RepID=A0A1I7XHB9_HETBA
MQTMWDGVCDDRDSTPSNEYQIRRRPGFPDQLDLSGYGRRYRSQVPAKTRDNKLTTIREKQHWRQVDPVYREKPSLITKML